ncbi:membrane-bound transcription factor site-2 protease isoform X1 [Phymastichus coffea]|uniref:membrane-bound transcription factor site-2 protease isoform X1 n=1 Tax=Phymastichus coffea TaxID=108790 RepID=UPI00273CA81F|nr:membrane-bound transcription factor site-2 protease isoform X1 [Phymastichus coffea]
MEALHVLMFIGFLHFSLFFFNTIFMSCMHLPYINLLQKFGIEIQFFRIKWFTAAFNRPLMRWGLNRSRFWSLWYNLGLIVTIILLPVSTIVILKMTINNWFYTFDSESVKKEQVLEVMVPGINIPYNEIGYYIISLILCSFFHELGHAMAAVREDVRFFGIGVIICIIIPVAFVHISDEQLNFLPTKNRLRILCAGIWHNIILSAFALLLIGVIKFCFSPFFILNTGVFIKDILPNSPLLAASGLTRGDVVHQINDCYVKNSSNWKTCILQAAQLPTPGYCVTDKIVKELDKSIISHDNNSIYQCCEQHNKNNGYLCFEHFEDLDVQTPRAARHFCLPTRAIVESSHNYCQNNDQCSMLNDICVRPALANMSKLVQIQRYGHKDVLFFGHPSEIYYTTDLTDLVPRFAFLSPNFPEALILLCKYIAVFSSGLAIINVVPCFYFDGQHIAILLTERLLRSKIHQQCIRKIVALIITTIFTFLLGYNLILMYLIKF